MFGFKHTLNNFDHNEVTIQKSRLLGRLIQVNGVNNLPKLFLYLITRVRESMDELLVLGRKTPSKYQGPTNRRAPLTDRLDGISLPIAQTVRTLASRTMCVMFFGERLCKSVALIACHY